MARPNHPYKQLCARCGFTAFTDTPMRFCPKCGSNVLGTRTDAVTISRAGALPTRVANSVNGRKWLAVVIAFLIVVPVTIVFALFELPIPQSTTGEVSTAYCSSCSGASYFGFVGLNLPAGPIEVDWSSTSSSWVQFTVFASSSVGAIIGCSSEGVSGTCSFESEGGAYDLALYDGASTESVETVTWTAHYSSPIW